MRDKRSFDDVEMPEAATTPIDGMSDEQWAARNERQGKIIRRVCAVAVGLAVGLVFASRFAIASPYYVLASWFVIVGSVLLAWALVERGDDEEILQIATSTFPEWTFLELLPLRVFVAIFAFGVCILGAIAALCLISLFPALR
jgi:hypothetical protein